MSPESKALRDHDRLRRSTGTNTADLELIDLVDGAQELLHGIDASVPGMVPLDPANTIEALNNHQLLVEAVENITKK